jgi:hypothetical protein
VGLELVVRRLGPARLAKIRGRAMEDRLGLEQLGDGAKTLDDDSDPLERRSRVHDG